MYLFTLIAIPAFCLGTYFMRSKNTRKSFLPPVIAGFISAAVYCFIETFFFISNRIWTENFYSSYIYLFLSQTLIPSIVITALFFFFSKDDLEYKFDSILPLLSSFYSVFLPYKIFTAGETRTFFPLFEKTILYISLLIFICTFLKKAYSSLKNKKIVFGILFILLTLVSVVVPAAIEIIWYYNILGISRLFASAAYLALAVFVFLKLTVIEFKE